VDPKTILCVFHKAGKCAKGWKCKYSHDLKVERKVAKAAIYEQASAFTFLVSPPPFSILVCDKGSGIHAAS
jgi:hypothetical protein